MATDPTATDIHFAESALAAVQYTASAATAIAVMVRGNMALEDQPRQVFIDIFKKLRRFINSDATITSDDVNAAANSGDLTQETAAATAEDIV